MVYRSIVILILVPLLLTTLLPPPVGAIPLEPDDAGAHVWPAATRHGPFLLGAVEAFRVPQRAQQIGVRWQRILFDWSVIQPTGTEDWELGWVTEELLDAEREAGRPVVGLLIGTPPWASGGRPVTAPPLGLDLHPEHPENLWATWVRAVAERFAGRVDAWVIWNEPDVWHSYTGDHQWTGTPAEYYRLLKVAYVAAKSVDPTTPVLMAGMTYWWDEEFGREQYFERLLREAAKDATAPAHGWYFDGAVLQLYNNPRGLFEVPARFRAMMRRHGFEKPIWVNETNTVPWDDPWSPLPRADYRATQEEQASYLVQAAAYALAAGVERLAVYKMRDDDELHAKPVPRAYGLVRGDEEFTLRPVARTFQMLSREFAETTRAQLVDDGPIRRVYLEQPTKARRLTVIWNMGAVPVEVQVPALGRWALAMDKSGQRSMLSIDAARQIRLTARGATANTLPGYPDGYFIGGEPIVLIEPLSEGYRPFAPTLRDDGVASSATWQPRARSFVLSSW